MIIIPIKDIAATATEELFIMLPEGAILKQVSIQNTTREWCKGSIILGKQQNVTSSGDEQIGLAHEMIQAGSRYISWRGHERIDAPYIYIIAQFFGCTAADVLWLIVGYEMSPTKKGWGS